MLLDDPEGMAAGLIQRAGGLTDMAFTEGSVFTRQELKLREQEQLDRLAAP